MTLTSYAQNFEDVMLWRALRGVDRGFYIDVGAWSPDNHSVTRLFYERGWRGLNIEANPAMLEAFDLRRPHDHNLGIAVSDRDGEAEMQVIGDTGLSTLEPAIARKAEESGFDAACVTVPMRTLAAIWDEFVPAGQTVHFLKVDVEGHEAPVIRGADWARHRPWVVVVEATVPMSQEPNHAAWEPHLVGAGYAFVWFDGLNRFYVADEHPELAAAFDAPPNVFDAFRTAAEAEAQAQADALRRDLEGAAGVEASLSRLLDAQSADLDRRLAARIEAATDARIGALDRSMSRHLDAETGRLHAEVERLHAEVGRLHAEVVHALHVKSRETIDATSLSLRSETGRMQAEVVHALHVKSAETVDALAPPWRRVRRRRARLPLWERLLFRPSGKPKKILRRALFHMNGRPRGVFRNLVLHPDGQPHKPFLAWMTSDAYQALPQAVRSMPLAGDTGEAGSVSMLSPDAQRVLRRVLARRAANDTASGGAPCTS